MTDNTFPVDIVGNSDRTQIGFHDDSGEHHSIVTAETNAVTGGIGIQAAGAQICGNAAPIAFTSRALTETDNGMVLTCASAQVATVNTGLPVGFGVAFKGIITFAGTATVTDVRTTGSTAPWCGLVQTATDTYDVVGAKA